jgi:hypothetical protein
VSLYTSSAFPLNVVGLGLAGIGLFAILCGLAAVAEVALLRAVAQAPPPAPFGRALLSAFTITLVATLPAVVAATALLMGLIGVAPDEFQSPDLGTPVLLRMAARLFPYLVAVALALLIGQAFGGVSIRRADASPERPISATLTSSARWLLRRPWAGLGVAAGAMVLDAVSLLVSYALLRVLWAPIATALGDGRLATPSTLLLLLGFVTIWLALLLVAGALHVAISAWWAIELRRGYRGEAR